MPDNMLCAEFESVDAALDYRNGRGGWVFRSQCGRAFVFAAALTRGDIFRGPWLNGLSGVYL